MGRAYHPLPPQKGGTGGPVTPPFRAWGSVSPQKVGMGMSYLPLPSPPQKGGTWVTRHPPLSGMVMKVGRLQLMSSLTHVLGEGVFWRLAPPMHYPYREAKQESKPCRGDIGTTGALGSVIEYIRVVASIYLQTVCSVLSRFYGSIFKDPCQFRGFFGERLLTRVDQANFG